MFEKHKSAIKLSGTPYITPIEAGRGYADGETIPIPEVDWSSENLEAVIALAPDQTVLKTLTVTTTSEQRTWRYYIEDECLPLNFLPCGVSLDDTITVTLLTIGWDGDFTNVPKATVSGEPITLYLEVRRVSGSGPRFAAGDFVLTESLQ